MRPDKLFALFSDVTRLKGVGPGARKALGRLFYGDDNARALVRDLAFHLPVGVIDRRNSPKLNEARTGDIVTLIVTVQTHQAPAKIRDKKLPYKVICHTKEGFLELVFFHARTEHIAQALPAGEQRVISGKLERYGAIPQMMHPDIIAPVEDLAATLALEPVYPLTGGMTNRHLNKIMHSALGLLPDLPEWIDEAYLRQQQWQAWKPSLLAAHHPQTPEDLSPLSPARMRLAYDEILANQLALALVRGRLRKRVAEPITPRTMLRAQMLAALPFHLTQGQQDVIREIDDDMASGNRMVRLLQGDVGSGKTLVALMAMLSVVESGKQAALMVPTELLARQHFASISRMAQAASVNVALLLGGMKAREHSDALAAIASGETQIVIGTHALLQDKVIFHNLALAVIDEQHRFGVAQRMALTAKASDTHMLVMTATPIPRTLTMTAFGDMDCSLLLEKPVGRAQITTKAIPLSREEEVLGRMEQLISYSLPTDSSPRLRGDTGGCRATGAAPLPGHPPPPSRQREGVYAGHATQRQKIYWICPLVEESDDENAPGDLAAAESRYIEFTHRFGKRVGLVHGRITGADRDRVMQGFAGDEYDILVATTVVEVGVDVPDATIIIIEHAERFGLAQLHQLRGRVGRSDKPSTCILLYADRCNEIAKSRLRVIRETNDGFRIAEEDLKLRGAGDILGIRQSGLPDFKFADLALHYDLMHTARDDARLILHRDEKLSTPRGQALRHLLYLFEYDENIRFLGAG